MPGPAASLRLGRYQRSWLRWDLLAGITTAAVVVPRGVAYASLAGLPVQVGLYVATVPMVVYALWGLRGQPAGQGARRAGRGRHLLAKVWSALGQLGDANPATVALALGGLAVLLALRRWAPMVPGPLVVVVLWSWWSWGSR